MQNSNKIIILIVAFFIPFIYGCGSTSTTEKEGEPAPTQPSASELIQKQLGELKQENESLKNQLSECEKSKRVITARAAELETQIEELKEKQQPPPPPPEKPIITDYRTSYDEALKLFRSRKYKEASAIFSSLLEHDIPLVRQDNCYYWLGECAYAEKKYNDAISHFQKVFTFKISEKKDESQLMIANCYLAMGNKEKAKEEYERLLTKFPASPFAKRVKEKLETLK